MLRSHGECHLRKLDELRVTGIGASTRNSTVYMIGSSRLRLLAASEYNSSSHSPTLAARGGRGRPGSGIGARLCPVCGRGAAGAGAGGGRTWGRAWGQGELLFQKE